MGRKVAPIVVWNPSRNQGCPNQAKEVSPGTFSHAIELVHVRRAGRVLDALAVHEFLAGKRILDVGSGAGLPGIILGIMGYKNIVLVESDFKKTVFIIEALRKCNIQAVVENKRVEDLEGMQGKTIVSRAFAPIDKTLFLLSDVISTKTKIFFLKGRAAKEEINNAKIFWKKNKQNNKNDILINFDSYSSLSNKDSFIVKCTFQEEKNNGKKTKNNICI